MNARIASLILLILASGGIPSISAQTLDCAELLRSVRADVTSGRLRNAESMLSATATGPDCEWQVLQDRAVIASSLGRLDEAENDSKRAIAVLDRAHAPDDPALLRPLRLLSTIEIQEGKVAAARAAFERMQTIHIETPLDRALLHGAAGTLLQAEKRTRAAESEYQLAIAAWDEASPVPSPEAAALLNGLADLYIGEKRYSAIWPCSVALAGDRSSPKDTSTERW
jgi:tetratricopeptide (TPR) repeat protein